MKFQSIMAVTAISATLFISGCVSVDEINRANIAIDTAWQRDYDKVIAEHGTRTYPVSYQQAFPAFIDTLQELGFLIEERDTTKLTVVGVALPPKPLTTTEWDAVKSVEEPRMKKIIAEEVGSIVSAMFELAPQQYRIIFIATMLPASADKTVITMTARLRYVGSLQAAYWPRHPPPLAAHLASLKIWHQFEATLAGSQPQPVKKLPAAGDSV